MKKALIGLIVIGMLSGAIYGYFFYLAPVKINNPLNAIPSNAAMIIQLEDPFDQWDACTLPLHEKSNNINTIGLSEVNGKLCGFEA